MTMPGFDDPTRPLGREMDKKTQHHTPGPYYLRANRRTEAGEPLELEIMTESVSSNFAKWLREKGKVLEPGTWGRVSFGTFHGTHNGSGSWAGPSRMLSEEEATANAKRVLLTLSMHDSLVAALNQAKRLFDEALPKFNWRDSALDANAIALLNEVPATVAEALELVKRGVIIK